MSENCVVEFLGCPSRRSSFCCSAARAHRSTASISGPPARSSARFERHYERNASEGNCYNPSIDGFTKLTVLEDTPDRLVVHARYHFRDRLQDATMVVGGGAAPASAERNFTLTRSPEGDLLVGMDGQQEEPALRTLIRRMIPN